MRHHESRLQQACVKWFRYQYNNISKLLIAVPNGGARSRIEASIMMGEGVVAGVADLLLLVPRKDHGALAIEMKAGAGKQTEKQKAWQAAFEKAGNRYVVCRDFEQFREAIESYLKS
ncbi:MAG: VRR-NUC domain-containing protein [Bacteroidales bacterium]